jgi:hypothetical protein
VGGGKTGRRTSTTEGKAGGGEEKLRGRIGARVLGGADVVVGGVDVVVDVDVVVVDERDEEENATRR